MTLRVTTWESTSALNEMFVPQICTWSSYASVTTSLPGCWSSAAGGFQRSIGSKSINGHLRKSLPQPKNIGCMTARIKVSDKWIYFSSFHLLTFIQHLFLRAAGLRRWPGACFGSSPGIPPLSFYQQHSALRLFITHDQWAKITLASSSTRLITVKTQRTVLQLACSGIQVWRHWGTKPLISLKPSNWWQHSL